MEIKGIQLKYNIRALMAFEQMGGGSVGDITGLALMLYSAYIAGGGTEDFDTVLDEIDREPNLLHDGSAWLAGENKKNAYFATRKESKKKD